MSISKRNVEGVTLLEVILVIAIALSILVLSLRQYYSFRVDADVLSLKNNVDTLFQSAVGYYQANCGKGGQLDPATVTSTVVPIDITNDLITPGFLESNFPQTNALVDSTGPGKGYIVQFNEYTIPRMQQVCGNPTDNPPCTNSTSVQIGTVVIWKIQVAVLMKNTSTTQLSNDLNYLQGDCLSSVTGSPPASALCSANQTGNYVVFERLPSFATSDWNSQSTYWLTNPMSKQFNQLYSTYPINYLTNYSHTTEFQYYYCSS